MIRLILAAAAFAATAPKPLSLADALRIVACRPITVSAQGPQTESFGLKEMAIELGSERFVRTDIGAPDGKLTVLRAGKKVCEIELSLIHRISAVPGKVLLLRQFSGSGSNWMVYKYAKDCELMGIVGDAEADKFAVALSDGAKLPACDKNK